MYEALLAHFGPRHWWPAETPFEVIIGAILTQNTAWSNVEKAIDRLKKAHALAPDGLRRLTSTSEAFLEAIRPSGYYNIKAARIKAFLDMLSTRHGNDLERFLSLPTDTLREELLAVPGIGQETADSILLYAAGRPVFVIDAYTLRIMTRHGCFPEGTTYGEAQSFFMRHLPRDVPLFNEYHALLVAVGKQYCRPAPRCRGCPLESV